MILTGLMKLNTILALLVFYILVKYKATLHSISDS